MGKIIINSATTIQDIRMKKIIFALLLATAASSAQSAALCQSMRDPSFQAWFEGWSCPPGYILLDIR